MVDMSAVAEALKAEREPHPKYEPYYPGMCIMQAWLMRGGAPAITITVAEMHSAEWMPVCRLLHICGSR